ncbi:MAG: hypothetical protein U0354_20495 [Candidatus Sericytochromatia bacterium]
MCINGVGSNFINKYEKLNEKFTNSGSISKDEVKDLVNEAKKQDSFGGASVTVTESSLIQSIASRAGVSLPELKIFIDEPVKSEEKPTPITEQPKTEPTNNDNTTYKPANAKKEFRETFGNINVITNKNDIKALLNFANEYYVPSSKDPNAKINSVKDLQNLLNLELKSEGKGSLKSDNALGANTFHALRNNLSGEGMELLDNITSKMKNHSVETSKPKTEKPKTEPKPKSEEKPKVEPQPKQEEKPKVEPQPQVKPAPDQEKEEPLSYGSKKYSMEAANNPNDFKELMKTGTKAEKEVGKNALLDKIKSQPYPYSQPMMVLKAQEPAVQKEIMSKLVDALPPKDLERFFLNNKDTINSSAKKGDFSEAQLCKLAASINGDTMANDKEVAKKVLGAVLKNSGSASISIEQAKKFVSQMNRDWDHTEIYKAVMNSASDVDKIKLINTLGASVGGSTDTKALQVSYAKAAISNFEKSPNQKADLEKAINSLSKESAMELLKSPEGQKLRTLDLDLYINVRARAQQETVYTGGYGYGM